ncbi:aldo/keto reductase [Agrococcus sp. SGAir0287]|uniref:aldo/keto reductase n=1 Tax=Agrococcus sp. SGAir0287 TaxID=2070347 RepID=UPI0010CCEB69|nr:aldo/keto reductase [Agrococcus sp. SGAir0287]QCR19855.1 oxidoreductase [Agrococcus sp. SGAir0287]
MVPRIPLLDGSSIPAIGLGLYKVPPEEAARVVADGIAAGYRLVDGAALYGNEAEMGAAVRASGLRDELQVVTKFWGDPVQSFDAALADFAASEARIGLDVIDGYMIHWPRAPRGTYVETWRALQTLRDEGRVRWIGVANFGIDELQRLADETGEWPAVNQVESHPWLPQRALRAFHAEHGIVTQAWSPLGRGRLLADPTIVAIAEEMDATPAQVVLRWHLQLGGAAVPKSLRAARLAENLAEIAPLDDAAMARIASLESGERTGTAPEDRP